MRINHLEARVRAVNAANAEANAIYAPLAAALEPFVGQKILKVDGYSFLQKVEKALPELPHRRGDAPYWSSMSHYRGRSDYSLIWVCKACENILDDQGCTYYETSAYIGDLDHGVLKAIKPQHLYRTDYNAAEVIRLREEFKVAEKIYSEAKSALNPFGEYDR
jgi:hypothetical protein